MGVIPPDPPPAGVFARLLLEKENFFFFFLPFSENRMVTEKGIFTISFFFFFPSYIACLSNQCEQRAFRCQEPHKPVRTFGSVVRGPQQEFAR